MSSAIRLFIIFKDLLSNLKKIYKIFLKRCLQVFTNIKIKKHVFVFLENITLSKNAHIEKKTLGGNIYCHKQNIMNRNHKFNMTFGDYEHCLKSKEAEQT